jgi:hypothetical protein
VSKVDFKLNARRSMKVFADVPSKRVRKLSCWQCNARFSMNMLVRGMYWIIEKREGEKGVK